MYRSFPDSDIDVYKRQISTNAGAQLASDLGKGLIQGTSQYIAKKMRTVKVHLKAGYRVMLYQDCLLYTSMNDSGLVRLRRLSTDELVGTEKSAGLIERYFSLMPEGDTALQLSLIHI